jgi:hypothetical protein
MSEEPKSFWVKLATLTAFLTALAGLMTALKECSSLDILTQFAKIPPRIFIEEHHPPPQRPQVQREADPPPPPRRTYSATAVCTLFGYVFCGWSYNERTEDDAIEAAISHYVYNGSEDIRSIRVREICCENGARPLR